MDQKELVQKKRVVGKKTTYVKKKKTPKPVPFVSHGKKHIVFK